MSPRHASVKAALLLACLGALLAGRAWSLGTDKRQPINIHADHADFEADPNNASNGTGIYTGHVVITQGSIVLQGDKAILHIVNNDLSTADVTGDPVTFVQQPDTGEPMHGEAHEITYDAARNDIVLISDAKLLQQVLPQKVLPPPASTSTRSPSAPVPAERLMSADVIHYNTDTQHVVAKSGDQDQRVHMSFPPKTLAPPAGTASAKARKSITVPPAAGPASTTPPTTLGAPPQSTAPAAASTTAPAADTGVSP